MSHHNDFFLLAFGIDLGAVLMLLVYLICERVDERRWQRSLDRARAAVDTPAAVSQQDGNR